MMRIFYKLLLLLTAAVCVVRPFKLNTYSLNNLKEIIARAGAHISPDIVNEFSDFAKLIPASTVDDIAAKHFLLDKEFRTAVSYLGSEEFTQLQQQLLNTPEVIDVLEFLHLTTTSEATRQIDVAKSTVASGPSISDDQDGNEADTDDTDNGIGKIATNTGIIFGSKPNDIPTENRKVALNDMNLRKWMQQLQMEKVNNYNVGVDVNGVNNDGNITTRTHSYNEQQRQPLVHIVLLENLEVNANDYNEGHQKDQHYQIVHHGKYQRPYEYTSNNHHHHHRGTLGTFVGFVEEILQHLPHSDYQNMIVEKCTKNEKFAQFYKALRSPILKPLIDEKMLTANIIEVINTLKSHGVDVKSLVPIAFTVISWGPNI